MTVKELIEELKKYPEGMEVMHFRETDETFLPVEEVTGRTTIGHACYEGHVYLEWVVYLGEEECEESSKKVVLSV